MWLAQSLIIGYFCLSDGRTLSRDDEIENALIVSYIRKNLNINIKKNKYKHLNGIGGPETSLNIYILLYLKCQWRSGWKLEKSPVEEKRKPSCYILISQNAPSKA